MYESEDSSVGSSSSNSSSFGESDEMVHFMNRCSICFEEQLDFCLELCRDQYCLDCFEKYIVQVVKSSWGLSVTPVRCPVCSELIPKHEWTQYVPGKIVDMYEKYNKPYRSYTRTCSHCQDELTPCVYNGNNRNQLMQPNNRLFCDIMESMLFSCYHGESHKNHADHIAVKRWITIYKRQDWLADSPRLLTLYKSIMQDVLTFEEHHIKQTTKRFAYNMSHEFINHFCVNPNVWKSLQFAHINNFPHMNCTRCHASICLHCGYDAHPDVNCEQHMKLMIKDTATAQELKDTVQWTMDNSRQCPNCRIMINRDEGCNKVDCSYCGFCFCWACRSSWADGCGFYRCANVPNQTPLLGDSSFAATTTTTTNNEDKTEVGVPNVKNIQARLVNHHFQRQQVGMEID